MHSIARPRRHGPPAWLLPGAAAGAAALLLILAGMFWASIQTNNRIQSIRSSWQTYAEQADPKGLLISEIRGYFGYGGFIHNFKNYVLRRDPVYFLALTAQTDLLLDSIHEYRKGETSPEVLGALGRVESVVQEYARQAQRMSQGIAAGRSAEEIDALVRVDDTEAIRGLQQLEAAWAARRQQTLNEISRSLAEGEALVVSLRGLMLLLLGLTGLIGVLIYRMVSTAYQINRSLEKELEARLEAQFEERKLSWVVQQSPACILVTDTSGRIEFANKRQLDVAGFTACDMIGQTPRVLKSGHTPEPVYAEIWRSLKRGDSWSGVFKNLRKDGTPYWSATNIYPLKDEDGEVVNYISIGEDITGQVQMDEQIAQVQKMEAVGILAGSLAHDFNNVLMTILGNAELIRMEAEDLGGAEEIDLSAGHVQIAARRARALLQQLLTFARRQPGRPQRLDVPAALEEVAGLFRASVPPTIRTRLELPEGGTRLATEIDPTALFQMVMNLCQNAAEAIGAAGGQITLRLTRQPKCPEADLPEDAIGCLRIEVEDNGPGIPKTLQQKVFTPFFSTKPVGKGTGLGLAIVQNWAEEAGGRVSLDSTPGTGTRFTICLPEFQPLDAEAAEEPAIATGHEHVLLVDDDETLLFTLRRMLARLGYRVEAYGDPQIAREAFRAAPGSYDILVSDLMMPGLRGDDLLRDLRDMRPDLPAMIISSYFDDARFDAGVSDAVCVAKPVDLRALALAMRSALNR